MRVLQSTVPLLVLPIFLTLVANAVADDWLVHSVLSTMNQTVDPCQDFYEFSCGGWITHTKLPADKSRYDRSFSVIQEHNEEILLRILQDPSTTKKLTNFYESCMNTTAIDAKGATPLTSSPLWQMIDDIRGDLSSLSFVNGVYHGRGIGGPLFGFYTTIDAEDPEINIAGFGQGGLGLPYAGLYLGKDNETVKIQKAYVQHITKMFQLAGVKTAALDAAAVMEFETAIANFTVPPDELTDPFTTYNKLNVSGLQKIAPNIDFREFEFGLGRDFNQATVDVPAFYSNLSAILPLYQQQWAPYLRWHLVHHYATRLSKAFVDENFDFYGKLLSGQKEQSPRSETCIGFTDDSLGELLGSYFLEEAFAGDSKEAAVQILHGIEDAMQQDLTKISWMDEVTRQRALKKLSLVSNMIGGPSTPLNYSDVDVYPNEFFLNMEIAELYATTRSVNQIEQPSNKQQWEMTPSTVNAYYEPSRNQMVFPAGILQTPYFNITFPVSMNTGGIGMVMGHELTHGFDNQGRDFDGTGKLVNWWEPETSKKFDQKVQCVIDQYSKFEVLPGVYINGKLTQGENIADMGGIKNAYYSYMKIIGADANKPSIVPGLSNIELFFVAFAQGWCEKATDEALKVQVQTNPHSPAKFRVLGPLINLPEFASTYQCKSGSFMNPPQRCEVW